MEKEELQALLAEYSRQEIAEKCGVSASTVSRWIRKYNLTRKNYGPKLNFGNAQKIRAIYQSGQWNQEKLAIEFDVSQATISKIINNETYKTKGPKVTGVAEVKVGYVY